MANIYHDFPVDAPTHEVFRAITTPDGINQWWSLESRGSPAEGNLYELSFGPGYDWTARVTRCVPNSEFEVQFVEADPEWTGARIGFRLEERDGSTQVSFYHLGWPEANAHYRISSFCWAMYLRILRRYLEYGETVAYEDRLDV